MASRLGVPGYDDLLPDLSAAAIAEQERREDRWAARFAALADDTLTADEQIDRDLIRMRLRARAIMRDFVDWRRNAESYLEPALDGVFTLFLHRLSPDADLAVAAAARLRGLPDLLAAARDNLDPALIAGPLLHRAVQHARAAVRYLRDTLPGELPDGPDRARLAAAAEPAAEQVAAHAGFLAGLVDRAAPDGWAIGADRYSALLHEAEGLTDDVGQLHDRGQAAYDALAGQLAGWSRRLTGDDDWPAMLRRFADDHPATPEQLRADYAEWTARARAFCVEHDLVSFPDGEQCRVEPSPRFTRQVLAVAFYVAPPPFSAGRVGHFFVPYPPEGATAEEVAQRLANNSTATIPTTAVHEAYPGHHWHLAWLAATCRRPVRHVLGSAYLVEGWGLYAEQLLAEQGLFADPRHAVGQLEARLFRAARIVVDTGLHSGELTIDEAVQIMVERACLPVETARAEVLRYCRWPTQAASYLTGSLEIERMRAEFLTAGRGSLRDFHDRLAGSGRLPLGLAARAVLAG